MALRKKPASDTAPTPTPSGGGSESGPMATSVGWIRDERWLPLDAPIRSRPGSRDPSTYFRIAQQFRVTEMPRYMAVPGKTWCNIYAWDVTRAMGAEIPHWYDPATGNPMPVGKGSEMRANDMVSYLEQMRGGWQQVPSELARSRAAAGYPTVIVWRNPDGPGHIAMLLPDGTIAQAGASNLWRGSITAGFGYRPLKFFTHD